MDAIQFHIALAIYNEFVDESVEGFEYWRDAVGVLHFVGVSDGAVLEASVYLDDVTYFVFCDHVEDEESDEEDESDDDESSDEEYVPKKRSRRE